MSLILKEVSQSHVAAGNVRRSLNIFNEVDFDSKKNVNIRICYIEQDFLCY